MSLFINVNPDTLKNVGNKGKPHTEESKKKISETRKLLFADGLLSGKNKIKFYKENPDTRTFLYLVMFSNNNETFIKIGISEVGVQKRFRSGYENYNITIIQERCLNAYFAASLEKILLKKYRKKHAYNPKNFNGRTECFITNIKDSIVGDINKIIEGYSGDGEDSNPIAIEFNSLISRHKKSHEELSFEMKARNDSKNFERNKKLQPLLAKIDFSKWGSLTEAAKIIGISPQKTRKFIRRNFPELL